MSGKPGNSLFHDPVVNEGPEIPDPVVRAGGVHPVGQKDYDDPAIKIHPQGCACITQMADRKG